MEGHYILIKGTTHQEDITTVRLYVSKVAPYFIKQTYWMKRDR
jgi:hypothetical protein